MQHWEKNGAKTAPHWSRFGKWCHLGGWSYFFSSIIMFRKNGSNPRAKTAPLTRLELFQTFFLGENSSTFKGGAKIVLRLELRLICTMKWLQGWSHFGSTFFLSECWKLLKFWGWEHLAQGSYTWSRAYTEKIKWKIQYILPVGISCLRIIKAELTECVRSLSLALAVFRTFTTTSLPGGSPLSSPPDAALFTPFLRRVSPESCYKGKCNLYIMYLW